MEKEKSAVEQLEDYLDDYSPISCENASKALTDIYRFSEKTTPVFLKIIRHINQRIDEIVNFAYIVSDSKRSEDEKKELAFEALPFKEGDIDVENKILAAEYHDTESKSYESLIADFLGEARFNYDDLEENVVNFIRKHNLTFETIREIEEENRNHSKTRANK